MKKNAGIRSKKELARRLIDGEEFFLGDVRVFFDENEDPPFRYGNVSLITSWEFIKILQIEVDWRDNIGDGVLCWVWDGGVSNKHKQIRVVVDYREDFRHSYLTNHGLRFENAEPVMRAEIEKYILE